MEEGPSTMFPQPPPPPRRPPRPRVTLPDRHPGGFPYESGGDDRRLA